MSTFVCFCRFLCCMFVSKFFDILTTTTQAKGSTWNTCTIIN